MGTKAQRGCRLLTACVGGMIDTEQAEERDRSQIVDRADDMEEALEMSINRRRRENRRALLA
jgi:hypothetical protein